MVAHAGGTRLPETQMAGPSGSAEGAEFKYAHATRSGRDHIQHLKFHMRWPWLGEDSVAFFSVAGCLSPALTNGPAPRQFAHERLCR